MTQTTNPAQAMLQPQSQKAILLKLGIGAGLAPGEAHVGGLAHGVEGLGGADEA